MPASAADRVSGPPCAGTSVRRCMPQGFVILTAKPVRRSRRKGPAAGTRPGRSRCRRRLGPGFGPETGAGPGLSACPAPGRRPCPRTPRQSRPPRPRPPRRSSKRLPETPVSLPGITLSDEGGQGERARSRRYGRQPARRQGRLSCARRIIMWARPGGRLVVAERPMGHAAAARPPSRETPIGSAMREAPPRDPGEPLSLMPGCGSAAAHGSAPLGLPVRSAQPCCWPW
jgi:hypothetical protein